MEPLSRRTSPLQWVNRGRQKQSCSKSGMKYTYGFIIAWGATLTRVSWSCGCEPHLSVCREKGNGEDDWAKTFAWERNMKSAGWGDAREEEEKRSICQNLAEKKGRAWEQWAAVKAIFLICESARPRRSHSCFASAYWPATSERTQAGWEGCRRVGALELFTY